MRNLLSIIFLVVLLHSCNSNTIIKKPDDLIPKEQMVELITDMMLASGAEGIRNLDGDRKIDYYPLIFAKHNIDSTQFKQSNFYYTSRIDDYEEILLRVEAKLEEMRVQFDRDRILNDSLTPPEERVRPEDYDY